MALAQVSNQLLRSQGSSDTTVAANYPITGDGSTDLPLGLAEDYRGADGESLTFNITDITDGHRVTISGIQGSSSFDVLNGQDGANGVNGVNGADGQSVTFDITNIASGHRVTLSGVQGSASFDVMNGENGVDGVSPTFRFQENADGVTVYVSGAQGEDYFTLYNGQGGHDYSAGPNINITDYTISGKDWTDDISAACQDVMQMIPDYSAGPNIDITNNTISGRDWTADIESAISSVSGDYYPMTGNPSGFLTAVDLSNYYQKNETSSKEEISAAIEAIPGAVDYSAGANINITNHVVSGKDWSTYISNAATAGSAAATAWVENQNYLTAHQSLDGLMSASKLEYNSSGKISGYDGSAFAGENRETIPVRGDNGISVSEVNNDVVIEISSVAHDATLSGNGTVASPLGVIGGGGKTYSGIAPIVVNNVEDKISANCIELSAGNGIDSVKLAQGVIEVSSQGGAGSLTLCAWNDLVVDSTVYAEIAASPEKYAMITQNGDIAYYAGVSADEFAGTAYNYKLDNYNTETQVYTISSTRILDLVEYGKTADTIESPDSVIINFSAFSALTANQIFDSSARYIVSLNNNNNTSATLCRLAFISVNRNILTNLTAVYTGIDYAANKLRYVSAHAITPLHDQITAISGESDLGGGSFESSAFGINPSLQVTALTGVNYYDTGVGNSNQLSGNNTNNLGWTMPSAYANVKNDIINDAMPVVNSRYSYKLSYSSPATSYSSNSGLRIDETVSQQIGTFRRVYSGEHVIGELVPTGYASNQYLTVSQAGALQWNNFPELGAPIVLVATSGDIPASGASDNKVYIVTGNS